MSRELLLAEVAKIRASADALEALAVSGAGEGEPPPPDPGGATPRGLDDAAAFFNYVRSRPPLGPKLSAEEVQGCERILGACAAAALPVSWAAYVLATAIHETAGQLRPLREYGKGAGRKYGAPGKHGGQVAYGRGDVQLTWDLNYEKADQELGLGGALIANYDLALDPAISAKILVRGMEEGWFTGKSLRDFLPVTASADQFKAARRVINGQDRAEEIAGYAMHLQTALKEGGWS